MKNNPETLLLAVDFAGTFVFAIEGATLAVERRLDPLGVMVLAFATALGGGVIRDLLIGAIPPNSIRDWRYPAIAFSGGAVVLGLYPFVHAIPPWLLIGLDAGGLSLFAISGAKKARAYGIHAFMAVLMGGITGVGGGTVRDMLLAQVPTVLRADVYAVAALAGAAVLICGQRLGMRPALAAMTGGLVCFTLRAVSVWQHWNLPRP